jgi:hypothetical protein
MPVGRHSILHWAACRWLRRETFGSDMNDERDVKLTKTSTGFGI